MKLIRILFVFLMLSLVFVNESKSQVAVEDSLILVEFYWATNGPSWINNSGWLVQPVGQWFGVQVEGGPIWRVSHIELMYNNLTGALHPLLFQLEKLVGIYLDGNNITGSLPYINGDSLFLVGLSLGDNYLTGDIPGKLVGGWNYGINIRNNLFSGAFSDSVMNSFNLSQVDISGNKYSVLPKRTNGFPLGTLRVKNNCFTFEDVLPHALQQPLGSFLYAPQDSVLSSIDTTILPGTELILESWVDTCSDNMYRWKKNGVYLTPNQQSSSQWVIDSVLLSDSGFYTCDIRNIYAPDLVLHRRMIHVGVSNTNTLPEYHPEEREIRIGFNPNEQMLQVSLDFNTETPVVSGLYDVSGRKAIRLYEGTTRQQEFRFNLDFQKAGVYFVKIQTDTKLLTRKIVLR